MPVMQSAQLSLKGFEAPIRWFFTGIYIEVSWKHFSHIDTLYFMTLWLHSLQWKHPLILIVLYQHFRNIAFILYTSVMETRPLFMLENVI